MRALINRSAVCRVRVVVGRSALAGLRRVRFGSFGRFDNIRVFFVGGAIGEHSFMCRPRRGLHMPLLSKPCVAP